MKTKIGIWIDQSKAIIVTLNGNEEHVKEVASSINDKYEDDFDGDKGSFKGQQHISNERKNEAKYDAKFKTYLKQVAAEIKQADLLYIFGPANTKNELSNLLTNDINQYKFEMNTVETADSMTLNQVVANVKSFFTNQKTH
jgi:stalled ribosome rescue protein Dom34